ncbi:hypothetical protein [Blastomonas sp.]|uniref:hypothetical protein n=1 Tax=Blastomonas sp. TaxID=1909299 RepID=UPI0035948A5A
MGQSTRYGLVGIGGLALLTAVHWLRDQALAPEPVQDYLLGVLPNFAAAIAITFVLLGIWSDAKREAGYAKTRRSFFICAGISGLGLIAWEFFQTTSDRLVFDLHDIGATLVGLGVSALLFFATTRREHAPQV